MKVFSLFLVLAPLAQVLVMIRSLIRLGSFSLLAVVLMGCADPYEGRKAISGKVTLKATPLNDGFISFEPLDNTGTTSGGEIKNGSYTIERKHGLKPGKYLIRITAGDGKTPANEEEIAGPGGSSNIVSVDRIPKEWNVESQKQVEVTESGENVFNFDVPNENVPKGKSKAPRK